LAHFKSRAIPVEQIRLQDSAIIVKLHYREVVDSADDGMKDHVLTIVRTAADKYEESRNVIIEIFDTGVLLSELRFPAPDAFAYAQGRMDKDEILSKMTVKEHLTIEEMLDSLIPKEADADKPIKIINPPVVDTTQPKVDPNGTQGEDVTDPDDAVGQTILFQDNFDSENGGRGTLNYRGFEKWDVASGQVDLIGNGFWDFHPDHGLHVDLDGSANKAATLRPKSAFKLSPGTYALEFDLAGNFQRTVNTMRVSMGDFYDEEFTLPAQEPFRKIKRKIKVSSAAEVMLVFQHEGGDNFGLLLDNVRLSKTAGDESTIAAEPQDLHQQDKEQLDQELQANDRDDGLTTYFGAVFDRHADEGIKLLGVLNDTPAQNTGLQKADIILAVENVSFRDKGSQPEQFGGMIQELPVDRPLRFHMARNGKQFDVWIKPLRIDKEQLAAFQDEVRLRFSSNYARAKRLLADGHYAEAVSYFQKSLKANSHTMESYQGLGICYYHLGKHQEARKFFENAIKMDESQPLSWFYGAANMDALNKRNGAMGGYRQYLKLNHDNAEMNAFARKRLDALTRNRGGGLSDQLLRVLDAITSEIEN